MKTVEIRWKEVASDDELSDFNSYLKEMEDVDTPAPWRMASALG